MMKCRFECLSTRNSILPPLISVDRLRHVGGDGAGLRVRHQTTRAEHAAEAADLAHEVRGGDDGVEVQTALRDLVDQFVGADDVGARGARCLGTVTGREDQDPGGLAGAVRKVHGATDHLVGLARVDAQAQGDLDGAVELGGGGVLGETDGLERGVRALLVDLGVRSAESLAALHFFSCGSSRCGVVVRAAHGPSTVEPERRGPRRWDVSPRP